MITALAPLCLAGPAWPVAAQPGNRPPGVAPPVDPTARARFVGVAPAAEILAIRQGSTFYSVPLRQLNTGQQTSSSAGDTRSMARAVMRAVQLGATVINISEAACFPAEPNQVNAPDLQAAVHYAVEHNVVVVVAAAISSPGWFDSDVLTVAATYDDGQPADFSIRGPWVDVAAPSTGAVSLAARRVGLTAGLLDAHGQAYPLSGTSFAAPYVAGLAALVRDRFTNLSARQVIHRIERTARHPAGPRERNEDVGYSMIDPVAALTAVLPEEHGTQAQPVLPSTLDDRRSTLSPDNTLALAGSAAVLGVLGLTLVVIQTVKRQRQRPG